MLNLIFLRVSANALSNPGMIIVMLILLSPFFIYGYSLTNKLAEILKTDYPKLFMEYEDELTGLKRDLKVVLFASEIRNLDDKRVQDIRKKILIMIGVMIVYIILIIFLMVKFQLFD